MDDLHELGAIGGVAGSEHTSREETKLQTGIGTLIRVT
jgi:hypothetical protein